MKEVYVIKSFYNGKYISIEGVWDDAHMAKEFEHISDATHYGINEIFERYIIEKIYYNN